MDSENTPVRRGRNWCFTINNPTDQDIPVWPSDCTFAVYQLETGENGTPHYQGYARFKNPKSLLQVKAILPRAHCEIARGSYAHNLAYCTKSDSRLSLPVLYGNPPEQGKRTDLLSFRDMVMEGSTDLELIQSDDSFAVYARFPNLAERIRLISAKPRFLDAPPTVIVCIGLPGTGKSHYARERFPTAYFKPNVPWWPLYTGQDVVVFDDFNGSAISFTDLKLLLDKGPFIASVKNGHVQMGAHTFVLTTNFAPRYWYSQDVLGENGEDALLRRITKFIHFRELNGLRTYAEVPDAEREAFVGTINAKFK